jgi:N-acetylglucosaminyldiphosphoundecaprenol N-acetyl-beta-D-mannosaminyltransferase
MNSYKVLGVKVDEVAEAEAKEQVLSWLKEDHGKYFISTPNIEFIMAARSDHEFRKVLNEADLAIPDSARFGWTINQLEEKNIILKLLRWPFFFFPKSGFVKQFPVLAGTDFMQSLIELCAKNNLSIGLLGGKEEVAEKLKQKLLKKYPNLNITIAEPGGIVDMNGDMLWVEPEHDVTLSGGKGITTQLYPSAKPQDDKLIIPKTDLLFVAFGQIKQEKWIEKNLHKSPVKAMMGVGGAFDYLSGEVPRAPEKWRKNGFEWLYRLIQQPWRAKRFLALIHFTFFILTAKSKSYESHNL